jgi:hypothetical protein
MGAGLLILQSSGVYGIIELEDYIDCFAFVKSGKLAILIVHPCHV